ncbi:hypothetical protein JW977_03530 [Candidatus Falkowbacteria bacterium]|nr:hypothetical protein [Candidatus Falkowbacteria bacterium]
MIKKYITSITKIFILLFSIYGANTVSAQGDHGLSTTAKEAGLGESLMIDAPVFLGRIAGAALAIAGSLFLFLMVYGGILIMSAAGDSKKVDKGKEVIKWSIIGAIVLGAAYAITALIFQAVGGQ